MWWGGMPVILETTAKIAERIRGDEPEPWHWRLTVRAASFPT